MVAENEHKIEDYTLSEEAVLTDELGSYYIAKRNENKKNYIIKMYDTSEGAKKSIDNEKKAYEELGKVDNLARLVEVIINDKNQCMVYDLPAGNPLKSIINGARLDTDKTKAFGRQLATLITKLHKKNIKFLNPTIDNMYYHEAGRLTVVGLPMCLPEGADKSTTCSPLASFSEGVQDATDWIALGLVLYNVSSGNQLVENITESEIIGKDSFGGISSELKEFIVKCFQEIGERKQWDALHDDFIRLVLEVQVDSSSITVGRFSIDWSDGFKVGMGNSGITISSEGLKLECGDGSISLGPEGLKIGGNDCELGLNPTEGISLSSSWCTCKIGIDGYSQEGATNTVKLNSEGFQWSHLNQSIIIPTEGEPQFNLDGVRPNIAASGFSINIDNNFILDINPAGFFYLQLGPDYRMVINSKGFYLILGLVLETVMHIHKNGVTFSLGNEATILNFNSEGLNGNIGDMNIVINKDGLLAEGEGIEFKVNKDGISCENGNEPINLEQVPTIDLSNLIKIPSPPDAPKPPPPPGLSMPSPGGIAEKLTSCCNLL